MLLTKHLLCEVDVVHSMGNPPRKPPASGGVHPTCHFRGLTCYLKLQTPATNPKHPRALNYPPPHNVPTPLKKNKITKTPSNNVQDLTKLSTKMATQPNKLNYSQQKKTRSQTFEKQLPGLRSNGHQTQQLNELKPRKFRE